MSLEKGITCSFLLWLLSFH